MTEYNKAVDVNNAVFNLQESVKKLRVAEAAFQEAAQRKIDADASLAETNLVRVRAEDAETVATGLLRIAIWATVTELPRGGRELRYDYNVDGELTKDFYFIPSPIVRASP